MAAIHNVFRFERSICRFLPLYASGRPLETLVSHAIGHPVRWAFGDRAIPPRPRPCHQRLGRRTGREKRVSPYVGGPETQGHCVRAPGNRAVETA